MSTLRAINNGWTIWNEFIKLDCKINYINLEYDYTPGVICNDWYNIKIEFENYDMIENFSNMIFKKYGIDINVNIYDGTFEIQLKNSNSNSTNNINNSILENLIFPPNVETIEITHNYIYDRFNLFKFKYPNIKLFNLPKNIHQLKICSSSTTLFDLSNLPTSLILLDISGCESKLNLDYLPNGLKVLYLPNFLFPKNNYSYNLSDLLNLPSSLIEINIGRVYCVNSVDDLIKKYDEKIKHEIKLNN